MPHHEGTFKGAGGLELYYQSWQPEGAARAVLAIVHGKGTPRFATEIAASAEWAMAYASEFKPPLLLLHGDADRIVDVQASRDFFVRVPHDDKKLIIYEGGYHEPHNDIEYERVVQDIKAWLEAHM